MTDQDLLYDVKDHVGHFTINRDAKRNAISGAVVSLFMKYLDQAETDATVRVVCITGAGEKAFCAGADLGGQMIKGDAGGSQAFADLLKRLAGFPKPTVARVNGHCLAGGMGFMMACDIVVAVNTAKFGTPEVNVGVFPMMVGALLFRNVPKKKAMEMVLLGEMISADDALEMGLITRVVVPDELDEEVTRILEILLAKSPMGMKLGKEAFYNTADMPFEEALDFLRRRLNAVSATKDAKEGITAFIEKRTPHFIGR
jgi:enoyl-CoA hydratase/carnithine racemase